MNHLRMMTIAPLAALLLAMMIIAVPTPARAADETNPSGNIIDNQITALTIDPATSIATIGGFVQCSTPTQLTVYGAVRQSHGASYQRSAEYFGASLVACGTTPTAYAVAVTPGYESARLVPGQAWSNTWAEYCGTTGCFGRGMSSDLRLVPAR